LSVRRSLGCDPNHCGSAQACGALGCGVSTAPQVFRRCRPLSGVYARFGGSAMTVILMTDRGRRLAGRRYCRRCGRLSGIRARDHATAGAAGGHAHAHQARASASPDHWPCFTARALDHRPPQYTDEELIKLAARDGILIESWRVASPLRAVPRVICVHACASAPPGAPVTTVQQTSPQPARAPHLGATGKLRDSHRYVKPPTSGTKARVRSVKPMTSFSTPRQCQ
jgi:hypothetical protein